MCWICLDGSATNEMLVAPCSCPRVAHPSCLARWQLQSAGKSEELHCRFCNKHLPDWRHVMTPQNSKQVTPYMRVSYGGKNYKLKVNPGPDGLQQFENEVRKLLKLPTGQDFEVIFHCRAPGSGDVLQLHGLNAYDAAVHCASVTAGSGAVQRKNLTLKQRASSLVSKVMSALKRM